MTREQCRELIPVLQAWAEGKAIQLRGPHSGGWKDWDFGNPNFEASEWRIKPDPREFWIVLDVESGRMIVSKRPLEPITKPPTEIIHVREVR